MSGQWLTTMKPTFQNEWLALPQRDIPLVLEKIHALARDPTPDGATKKKVKHLGGKLFRIRAGSYRIFYTFEEPYVSLLAIRKRDHAYDKGLDAESLGGLDAEFPPDAPAPRPSWEQFLRPPEPQETPLPVALSDDLLERLRVLPVYRPRLLAVTTREELYRCAEQGIPDDVVLRVDEVLFERPLEEVLGQPDYVANDVDDLLRFREGSLLGFLLKLDAEQEKYVRWSVEARGPTLLKGGPGTGKSTVALYRVRAMLDAMVEATPRILFTTYTNALVNFSRQLLDQLLGDRASAVEVRTADSLMMEIARGTLGRVSPATDREERALFDAALQSAFLEGSSLERNRRRRELERLGAEYLREEIQEVIEGRGLRTLEEYLAAPRPGRRVGLGEAQRRAVWAVWERYAGLLTRNNVWTWGRIRCLAREEVAAGAGPRYDAVVVDEAQDLPPVVLGVLATVCKRPNRLFLTADANQSIYRSGFRWADVHETLQFRGRTGVLRANHRSTREIAVAAASYAASGAPDPGALDEGVHVHTGPLPAVREVADADREVDVLARYLPAAARSFRLGVGACAVLVPTRAAGITLAEQLSARGVRAQFMEGRSLDLRASTVKVITLRSAKGLEFPVVALAGFARSGYPRVPDDFTPEGVEEWIERERRVLYVAMTRAMRALLVLAPAEDRYGLFRGWHPEFWNVG
ncbi:UvrD-helicase domain-containing protein [Deferrisoma sp.]